MSCMKQLESYIDCVAVKAGKHLIDYFTEFPVIQGTDYRLEL